MTDLSRDYRKLVRPEAKQIVDWLLEELQSGLKRTFKANIPGDDRLAGVENNLLRAIFDYVPSARHE